jgi:hypothetical protein
MYSINRKKPEKIKRYIIYPVTEGIVLALVALFFTALTAFFIYHHAMNAIEAEIKDGLLRTASGIAACIDGDKVASFDAPEKKDLPSYQDMIELLQKARLATKHCTYLYINRLVGDKVVFIVDPTPLDAEGKPIFTDEKNLEPSIPMKEYPGASNELLKALVKRVPVVSAQPYTDQWGTFYSAYVPIYDNENNFVGTLGADLRIDDMLARLQPIEDATKRAFFVSFALALLCGTLIWFARRFALQLNQSRFDILQSMKNAKEFADDFSARIGRQLRRMAQLCNRVSQDLRTAEKFEDIQQMKTFLAEESRKLAELEDKLKVVGELKISTRGHNLANFNVKESCEKVRQQLEKLGAKENNLETKVGESIPKMLYGPAQIYEEMLGYMGSFFLKFFSGKIESEVLFKDEGINEVYLVQKMQASLKGLQSEQIDFLKNLADKAYSEDFMADLDFAAGASMAIVRELIYLLNTEVEVKIDDETFEMSFSLCFKKELEDLDEEDEND